MGFGVASPSVDIDLSIGNRMFDEHHGYVPLTNAGEFACIASLTLVNMGSIMAKTAALVSTGISFGTPVPVSFIVCEFGVVNMDAYLRDEWYWDTSEDDRCVSNDII